MKTIDLRRQQVTLDELLRSVGDDAVRITSAEGDEFVIEPADALEREAKALGRSAKLMAFLAERSADTGRVSLADVESRLGGQRRANGAVGATADPEPDSMSHGGGTEA